MQVSAMILQSLPAHAGPAESNLTSLLAHLCPLRLADPGFIQSDPYRTLLSVREYSFILRNGVRRGLINEPIAQCTSLGWIVSGVVEGASVYRTVQECHGTADHN